jgi:HNH endonuclease
VLEWRGVPDWPYEVSDDGHVRRVGASEPRKSFTAQNGYIILTLSDGPRTRTFTVHRLMARAFFGEPEEGQQVRHLDGDQKNNVIANLAWGTQAENVADKARHGTLRGRSHVTHCPHGHEMSGTNLRVVKRTGGGEARVCATCRRASQAKYDQKRRAA